MLIAKEMESPIMTKVNINSVFADTEATIKTFDNYRINKTADTFETKNFADEWEIIFKYIDVVGVESQHGIYHYKIEFKDYLTQQFKTIVIKKDASPSVLLKEVEKYGFNLGTNVNFHLRLSSFLTKRGEEVLSLPMEVKGPIALVKDQTPLAFFETNAELIEAIVNKAMPIANGNIIEGFTAYARANFKDVYIDEQKGISAVALKTIAAHYCLKLIEQLKFEIRKTPVTTLKQSEEVWIYNGRMWRPIYFTEFHDLVRSVAIKSGLNDMTSRSAIFQKNLSVEALNMLFTVPEIFENKAVLNLDNGLLEFTAEGHVKLLPYTSDGFIKYYLPYSYNPAARCPLFDAFVQQVLPDIEAQTIIQEVVGALFINHLKFEQIAVLLGEGSNGKGVFLDIVKALVGAYNVSHESLEDLTNPERGANSRAQTVGKIVNIATEISSKASLDHKMFKALASKDPVSVKWLYKDNFTTNNYARSIFAANLLPRDTEHMHGFYRKLLVIAFEQTITAEQQNLELASQIIGKELSGILNWAITGFQRLCKQKKYSTYKKSVEIIEEYKRDTNSVALFFQENNYDISEHSFDKEPLSKIFDDYIDYCRTDGYKPVSKREFNKRARSLGFEIQVAHGNKPYIWIRKLKGETYGYED